MPKNKKLTGLSVKNVNSENSTAELYIYGEITEDKWWETDVTPDDIREALSALDTIKNIDLYVNSPGGGVFAGMAIYNILNRLSKTANITAYIDGIAASIAGVVVMVADKIVMPANTLLMIHDPLLGICGYFNIEDLEKIIAVLNPVKETILNVFEARMNISREEIAELMKAETYITASEALEYGLIDEIGELKDISTSTDPKNRDRKLVNGVSFDISNFKNFPADFLNEEKREEDPETEEKDEETQEDEATQDEEISESAADISHFENMLKLEGDLITITEQEGIA